MRQIKNLGFTIVELLLYMGLISIFLGVLTQIFLATIDVRLESESASNITQDARFILTRLEHDVARADSVVTPASLGDTSNSLSIIVAGQQISYGLSGDNLVLDDGTGQNFLNSYGTKVNSMSFTRIGNLDGKNSIKAAIGLESRTKRHGIADQKTLETILGTR